MSWEESRVVVVDIEGNGRQPPEIVELAIVVIEGGVIAGPPSSWLVRPRSSITTRVAALHGIDDNTVRDAPRFEEIADSVIAILEDSFLVAHNASVEYAILSDVLPRWRPDGIIDTLAMARTFTPGLPSYSLARIAESAGIRYQPAGSDERLHRAGYDAYLTALLFRHLATDPAGAPRSLRTLLAASEPSRSGREREVNHRLLDPQRDLF